MIARLRVWWTILRIAVEERLTYRADFALGTLLRFLPIITQIFLWYAISQANQDMPVAGKFDYRDMVAYYLLTMIARSFSSMPGLANSIALEIRSGTVKKYLIQPIDMLGYLLLTRTAHKLVYYAVALGPFALVFYLCRDYFPGWPAPGMLFAFVASLVLSFLLGFFLESTLGLIGFWFLEVSSLLFIYMLLNFFLSGHMFPLDMLTQLGWDSPTVAAGVTFVIEGSPLRYLAYFPCAVFLGKLTPEQVTQGMWMELGWVVFFLLAGRLAFSWGTRRYSAFGG